jgi:LysM repeat protein
MKLPRFIRRKKLRFGEVRRSLRASAQAEYDDMSEPNMKLSRALLVVLLLHVVAVSGIIAFNAIKTRQAGSASPAAALTNAAHTPETSTLAAARSPIGIPERPTGKPVPKDAGKTDHPKKAESAKSGADSHKTYVVAKGDNPVTIAKKLKVSYDDLIALNHISDPRKLRVGQKLLLPAKTTKSKKSDE